MSDSVVISESGYRVLSGLDLLGSALWRDPCTQGGTAVDHVQIVLQACLVRRADLQKFDAKQPEGTPPDNRELNFDRRLERRDLHQEVEGLSLLRRVRGGDHTSVFAEIDDVAFLVKQVAEDQHGCHGQDSSMLSMFPRHGHILSGRERDPPCGGFGPFYVAGAIRVSV